MEIMTNKYEVMFSAEQETARIRILEGKFADFIYLYKNVRLGDVASEDDEVQLSFTYELQVAPESYEYEDEEADKKEFEHTIGDILYDIIVNSDKVKESVDGSDDTK